MDFTGVRIVKFDYLNFLISKDMKAITRNVYRQQLAILEREQVIADNAAEKRITKKEEKAMMSLREFVRKAEEAKVVRKRIAKAARVKREAEKEAREAAAMITLSFTVYGSNINTKAEVGRVRQSDPQNTIINEGTEYKKQRDVIITTVSKKVLGKLKKGIYAMPKITDGRFTSLTTAELDRLKTTEVANWVESLSMIIGYFEIINIVELPTTQPFKRAQVKNRDAVQQKGISFPHFDISSSGSGKPETWLKSASGLKDGCCINILMNQFEEVFSKLIKVERYSEKHRLSVSRILEICRGDDKEDDLSLTLPQFRKFFERYNLKLSVIDIQKRLLNEFSFTPTKINKNINPSHTFVLQHNGHLYVLNAKSMTQIQPIVVNVDGFDKIPIKSLSVKNQYNVSRNEESSYLWLNDINELWSLDMKECKAIVKGKENKTLSVYCLCDLSLFVSQLVQQVGYEPSIKMSGGIITCVSLFVDGVFINVRKPCDNPQESDPLIENEEDFKLYQFWYKKLQSSLISHNTKSQYSHRVRMSLNELGCRPLVKAFTPFITEDIVAGDFCKAYTSCLQDEEAWSVCSIFDDYVLYDSTTIEPYNMYIVEVEENDFQEARDMLLFDANIVKLFGFALLEFSTLNPWILSKITKVCVPHRIVENNSKEIIKSLYKCKELCEKQKKDIVNHVVGLTGKRRNTKEELIAFQDLAEALAVSLEIGGSVFQMPLSGAVLYMVKRSVEEELVDGFRLMQEQIYQRMRLKLWSLAQGKEVVAVKTDCLWFKPFDSYNANEKPSGYESIGKVHWNKMKGIPNQVFAFGRRNIGLWMDGYTDKETHITLKNEWISDEYEEVFTKNHSTFISGLVPGAGKTYAATQFLRNKKAICFAPMNVIVSKLRQESGLRCETVDRWLGMVMGAEDNGGISISDYEYVLIDELALLTVEKLGRIKRIMDAHPSICFLSTGDVFQNTPVGEYQLNVEKRGYYLMAHHKMFRTYIDLQEPKRFKTKEQNKRIIKMGNEIKECESIYERVAFFYKYFKPIIAINDIKGTCISLEDAVAKTVDEYLHKKELPTDNHLGYYKGMKLLCRFAIKANGKRMANGERYTVEEVGDIFTVRDSLGDTWTVAFDSIAKYFRFNYAYTGYSLQGFTIDEDWRDGGAITIFNHNHHYASTEWLWTALSRVRDLDKVYFFAGDLRPVMHDCELSNRA